MIGIKCSYCGKIHDYKDNNCVSMNDMVFCDEGCKNNYLWDNIKYKEELYRQALKDMENYYSALLDIKKVCEKTGQNEIIGIIEEAING